MALREQGGAQRGKVRVVFHLKRRDGQIIEERGIAAVVKVEQVDPAYTSQECPACSVRNKAQDRTYVCAECGWMGHRDGVGAINISRRTGLSDQRRGATGA